MRHGRGTIRRGVKETEPAGDNQTNTTANVPGGQNSVSECGPKRMLAERESIYSKRSRQEKALLI